MRRIALVFVSMFVLGLMATVIAQQAPKPVTATLPAAAAPAPPPALDELELGWLEIVSISERLAYSECQRLEAVQAFNGKLRDMASKIEQRHPGWTVDRTKGVLVPKK